MIEKYLLTLVLIQSCLFLSGSQARYAATQCFEDEYDQEEGPMYVTSKDNKKGEKLNDKVAIREIYTEPGYRMTGWEICVSNSNDDIRGIRIYIGEQEGDLNVLNTHGNFDDCTVEPGIYDGF
mmetsp:Transcript_42977/g.30956  ORF Transcript_42977/g.30956 Transcript_42977/m.30956 type:complete len:123 (+) Transcript_42977:3-371(+)